MGFGRRAVILILVLTLFVGWSGQAFSFVTTGACVAPMTMEQPMDSDNADESPPCKGPAVACMGSLGCILVLGLARGEVGGIHASRADPDYIVSLHDLSGRTPEPELSPPILQA
jgi:hypothetical protein